MNREPRLALAYLEHAPQAAAQVLQDLEVEETAGFLETVPARLSAPVVNAMIPWYTARCLERVSPARAAAVLRQLAFNDTASLVRLMSSQMREPIYAELPAAFARRLKSSLSYPPSQIGAWIDPDVPLLGENRVVNDALRLLRDGASASHVFVQSEESGAFVGAVSVKSVLRGQATTPISLLPIVRVEPLSNRESLASVMFDQRWDEFLFLPVVGRRGAVLGGLSRQALRYGVREQRGAASRDRSLLGNLATALIVTCAGVVGLAAEPRRGVTGHPGGGLEGAS